MLKYTGKQIFLTDSNKYVPLTKSEDKIPLTYTIDGQPYIEAGVGVSNILKIFRVDFVKRFTYRNNPYITHSGFLIQFRFDI